MAKYNRYPPEFPLLSALGRKAHDAGYWLGYRIGRVLGHLLGSFLLWVLRRGSPWAESCSYCKGYPPPEGDRCRCSLTVRLRRWARGRL